jgi:DNA polymerase-3 subunit delta'
MVDTVIYPWLQPVIAQLAQAWHRGRFHHGLLIQGRQGSGKTQLANYLANALICQQHHDLSYCGQCKSCLLMRAGTHPDCRVIDNAQQSIGIDAIRKAGEFVYQKSQISKQRVLQINNGELLTEAAANALLKTLEEPCAEVYILITCNNPSRMLPTVVSRCAKVAVNASDKAQVYHWLNEQSQIASECLSDEQFNMLYAIADGAPLKMRDWMVPEKLLMLSQISDDFSQWQQGRLSVVQLQGKLQSSDFALLIFYHQLMVYVRSIILAKRHHNNGQVFEAISHLFAQLTRFGRDGLQILGQNKQLALIKLLSQLETRLKDLT